MLGSSRIFRKGKGFPAFWQWGRRDVIRSAAGSAGAQRWNFTRNEAVSVRAGDVALHFLDGETLFGNDVLHEVADRDKANQLATIEHGKMP